MKTRGFVIWILVLCAVMGFSLAPINRASAQPKMILAKTGEPSAVQTASTANLCDGALGARFLNMLNRNYTYDDDFYSFEALINNAVLAQLNLAEDDYVNTCYIADYLASMYGIQITDYAKYNTEFPQKDGYVYVIPRGYATYSHKLLSVVENEDGSYTVTTQMTVDAHDDDPQEKTVTSLFVPNGDSDFGFVMVYANTATSTDAQMM